MPEMIKAGDLKVGDKFRAEATVKNVGYYVVRTDEDIKLRTYVDVELEVELEVRAWWNFALLPRSD